jgi:Sensors of blue-light using FAD
MDLIELVYVSAAVRMMRDAELAQLLSKARSDNAMRDVTGLLVYEKGSFLQVLEGEPAVVDELFTRIGRDPRHAQVQMLSRQNIETRTFGDWRMGFAKVDRALARELAGHVEPSRIHRPNEAEKSDDSRSLLFLRGFRDGKWHRYVDGR